MIEAEATRPSHACFGPRRRISGKAVVDGQTHQTPPRAQRPGPGDQQKGQGVAATRERDGDWGFETLLETGVHYERRRVFDLGPDRRPDAERTQPHLTRVRRSAASRITSGLALG